MPYSYYLLGLYFGFIGHLFGSLITYYSIWLMIKAGNVVNLRSYEELCEAAFPVFGSQLLTIFMTINLFGALVGFLVALGDLLQATAIVILGSSYPNIFRIRAYLTFAFALFIEFPLCMFPNISKLQHFATLAVALIVCVGIIVVTKGCKVMADDLVDWPNLPKFNLGVVDMFSALPVITFAYSCQSSVFPVWKELKNSSDGGEINRVSMSAVLLSLIAYILVGFFGYISFPINTPPDILPAFPSEEPFYIAVRSLFIIPLVFHYPVIEFALRASLNITLFRTRPFSWVRHTIINLVVVLSSALVALFLGNLGAVFSLSGAISGYPISFIFPAIIYIKIMAVYEKNGGNLLSETLIPFSIGDLFQLKFLGQYFLVLLSLTGTIITLYTIVDGWLNG